AAPRIVFAAAKLKGDDNGPQKRILVRAKSNNGPDSGGVGYDLRQVELPEYPGVLASQVLWSGAIEGSARDLLREAEADLEVEHHDRADATEWLLEALNDAGGEMASRDALKLARDAGFSERTVERARSKAGVS